MIRMSLIYFGFLSLLFIGCSQIPEKLLDSSTPAYQGTIEPKLLDYDYFTNCNSSIFNSPTIANNFELIPDEQMIQIFEFISNYNFYLYPQLIYSCKRFYRLLTKSFLARFNRLSPQLFLALPPNLRLTFAMKYLWDFEELFTFRNDRKMSAEEVGGLVFVVLHLKNELYISPRDLKFAKTITTGFKTKISFIEKFFLKISSQLNSSSSFSSSLHQMFPYSEANIWRSLLLKCFIKDSIYFAVESLSRLDQSTIESTINRILLRNDQEDIESFEKDLMLLSSLLNIKNDKSTLKHLLNQSIYLKKVSFFNEFLNLWTDPIASIVDEENSHILMRAATGGLTLPILLDLQEIRQDHFLLASILKECEAVGNYHLATDLIIKFPSQSFSFNYDPHHIDLLQQIITSQWNNDMILPQGTQRILAMLLASFHFPQPRIVEIFKQLMRSGRIDKLTLEKLSRKKTLLYYKSVKTRLSCIIN